MAINDEKIEAVLAFSDAAHNWIEGRINAGEWMAAQRRLAETFDISLDVLNDPQRRTVRLWKKR